ncbi:MULTISPECIES: response regulator transcription factor [Aeromonas]|uniref:Response regulator transcription factor n=2 Tax=Aeromonas TaxID=642 RepID=A0AAW5MIC6_AERVE|nr:MULTISPECIES: response regulator transcription factor [Aeromonas]MBL0654482.1 response regulator transcription factor [Aeromonas caviae]MCR4451274.1 response regulator transcription factor [Aeromonas veronii]
MRKTNIMTLDDHALILRGLNNLLLTDSSLNLIDSFTTSKELLNALNKNPIDVVIMDYALSPDEMDGLSLIKHLSNKHPTVALLVVSAHYSCGLVIQTLRAGAKGFISKNSDPDKIIKAVHSVAKGHVFLDEKMRNEIRSLEMETSRNRGDMETRDLPLSQLSPKEHEVIRCFIEGMTVSDIAQKFHRSIKTISAQKQSAMRKLGIKTDHELLLIREELR